VAKDQKNAEHVTATANALIAEEAGTGDREQVTGNR